MISEAISGTARPNSRSPIAITAKEGQTIGSINARLSRVHSDGGRVTATIRLDGSTMRTTLKLSTATPPLNKLNTAIEGNLIGKVKAGGRHSSCNLRLVSAAISRYKTSKTTNGVRWSRGTNSSC